ncbi:porin family protein [Patescibacteria group bacterium]|nr:porin family protein [Patescibacteria group bacterium]
MKRIFGVIAVAIIFWSVFILLVNAQEVVSTDTNKVEIKNLITSTDTLGTEQIVISNPKFSVSIGLGNGYNIKEKDFGKLGYDNSPVSSIRVGYSPWKYIEIEGESSKASSFTDNRENASWIVENKFSITTLTLNLKIGLPIRIGKVSFEPYITKGVGTAKSKYVHRFKGWYERNDSYSSSKKCSKIGGGIEVKLYKDLFLFYEITHWKWKINVDEKDYLFTHSATLIGLSKKF